MGHFVLMIWMDKDADEWKFLRPSLLGRFETVWCFVVMALHAVVPSLQGWFVWLLSGRPRSSLLLILAVVSNCDCYNLWPSLKTPSSPRQMFDFNLVVGKNLRGAGSVNLKEYLHVLVHQKEEINTRPSRSVTDNSLQPHLFPFANYLETCHG